MLPLILQLVDVVVQPALLRPQLLDQLLCLFCHCLGSLEFVEVSSLNQAVLPGRRLTLLYRRILLPLALLNRGVVGSVQVGLDSFRGEVLVGLQVVDFGDLGGWSAVADDPPLCQLADIQIHALLLHFVCVLVQLALVVLNLCVFGHLTSVLGGRDVFPKLCS